MAQIGPQRIKLVVDGPALRIAALQAAVESVEGYAFPVSEGRFRKVITNRADFFLDWLQEGSSETFGEPDES